MNERRADRDLVIALLQGDPGALAAIYDRYADRLFDTAAAMLADRDEAADAVQDVFVTAAEKLGQLRDADRLGPWLFAVLRHTVYRRTRQRGRRYLVDPTAPATVLADMAATDDVRADGAGVSADELAAFVRSAARGLEPRDQLVLELSARQGLAGRDLADALGVSVEQSHVLVHRMRERVERSLGALTVARMGRRDCRELADLLRDWDGRFDVLVRKRVARHVERCEQCDRTSRRYAVVPLLGAAPALAAPPGLREAVLASVSGRRSAHEVSLDRRGFPKSTRRGPRTLGLVAAALLVLGVAGTTLAVVARDDGRDTVTAASAGSVDSEPAATSIEAPSEVPASAVASSVAPASSISTVVVDPASVPPIADDPEPATPSTAASTTTVVVSPPPASPTTVPPTAAPTAPPTAPPAPPLPPADVGGPTVTIVRSVPTISCPWTRSPTVTASVVDASRVVGVTLSWQHPRRAITDSVAMTEVAPGGWRGSLGIGRTNGTWTYTVTAVDEFGNAGSATGSIEVSGC